MAKHDDFINKPDLLVLVASNWQHGRKTKTGLDKPMFIDQHSFDYFSWKLMYLSQSESL